MMGRHTNLITTWSGTMEPKVPIYQDIFVSPSVNSVYEFISVLQHLVIKEMKLMLMECKMHQQMEVQTMVCKLQGWSVIQSCFPVFGFILCFSFVCFSVYPVGDVSSSVFFHLLYPL